MNLKAWELEIFFFLLVPKDSHLVDKIMQDLDANKDNEVDYNEFVVMVAALTVACNDYFVEQLKKGRKIKINSKLKAEIYPKLIIYTL